MNKKRTGPRQAPLKELPSRALDALERYASSDLYLKGDKLFPALFETLAARESDAE